MISGRSGSSAPCPSRRPAARRASTRTTGARAGSNAMKAKLLTAVEVVAALSASLWLLSSTRERGPKAPAVSRAESRNETTETGTMAPRRRRAPEARAEAPRVQQERQEADARDKEDTGDRERRAARHGTEP